MTALNLIFNTRQERLLRTVFNAGVIRGSAAMRLADMDAVEMVETLQSFTPFNFIRVEGHKTQDPAHIGNAILSMDQSTREFFKPTLG
jgi:hypothetical protein